MGTTGVGGDHPDLPRVEGDRLRPSRVTTGPHEGLAGIEGGRGRALTALQGLTGTLTSGGVLGEGLGNLLGYPGALGGTMSAGDLAGVQVTSGGISNRGIGGELGGMVTTKTTTTSATPSRATTGLRSVRSIVGDRLRSVATTIPRESQLSLNDLTAPDPWRPFWSTSTHAPSTIVGQRTDSSNLSCA